MARKRCTGLSLLARTVLRGAKWVDAKHGHISSKKEDNVYWIFKITSEINSQFYIASEIGVNRSFMKPDCHKQSYLLLHEVLSMEFMRSKNSHFSRFVAPSCIKKGTVTANVNQTSIIHQWSVSSIGPPTRYVKTPTEEPEFGRWHRCWHKEIMV